MADSPFEATARRLGALVGALDPRAQALFFSCAARALLADRADVVDDALAAAYRFAMSGSVPDEIQEMLDGLDALQASLDEVDVVAHDALICADIALRDATLARAVGAVDDVVARLSAKPTHREAEMADAALVALRP